jgi:hypothetical protein
MSLRDTVNHEKLLYPCWSTAESRLFGAEVAEKDAASSKGICVKSEAPQDFSPFYPCLVAEGIGSGKRTARMGRKQELF